MVIYLSHDFIILDPRPFETKSLQANVSTVEPQVKGHHVERPPVQELCESRGGCPGLSVLTSLLVSVDVKIY